MNPSETPAEKPQYNLAKIEELRKQAEKAHLDFLPKWELIGKHFGVSAAAVRKWYYRAKDKKAKTNKPTISSDQWRTAYLVLTGETSRDTIPSIKRKIAHLLKK